MLSPEIKLILSFFTSLIITLFAVPKVITFSKSLRLFAIPGDRNVHDRRIPIAGGIAVFSAIIFSLVLWSELQAIQFILVSLLIVFFVGVIDDLLSLSPTKKIIGQIAATLVLIFLEELKINSMFGVLGVFNLPQFISILFTIFVVIVIINAFNLIDGIDGLAAGIGVISSIAFGFTAYLMNQINMAMIAFTLTGSLLGFLKYNFSPARIFMGDTGSLVIGMIFSVLAINLIGSGIVYEKICYPNKGPLLAIVFLALPLFDSLRVFLNRVKKGKNPLLPGKDHVHHAMLFLGLGHKKTSLILYFTSIFIIITSYFMLDININNSITILAFECYILLLIPFYILRKKSNEI